MAAALTARRESTDTLRGKAATPLTVFLVATIALTVVLFVRNRYLFSVRIAEGGDQALNSLLVERASRFDLTIGNYSRVGFHHPGPGFLYLLASGQGVFYDLLHVVPTPFNGQLLGVFVADSIMLGLVVRIFYTVTRSVPVAALALGLIAMFAGSQRLFPLLWFPYLYMCPFALLVVAGVAVAAGRTSEIATFVFAGALLIHGHISFVVFVGGTTVAVAAGWLLCHRRGIVDELRLHRRILAVAVGIAAIFALPMVVHLVRHWPSPWDSYWRYATAKGSQSHHHSLASALDYLGWYWSRHRSWLPIFVLAAVLGPLLTFVETDPQRRRFFALVYGMAVLQTALFVVYLSRGVDVLNSVNRYTGYFYFMIPLIVVVAAASHLALTLRGAAPATGIVALAAGVALFGVGATLRHLTDGLRGDPEHTAIVAALDGAARRHGREVRLGGQTWRWPTLAGVQVAASRRHLPMCVGEKSLTNFFTSSYMCTAPADRFDVSLIDTDTWNGRGAVIWHDAATMVVTGDVSAVADRS